MYSTPQLASKYLQYYIKASNGRGHGTHSPFVYSFIREVLNDKKALPEYALVETLRADLSANTSVLEIQDFGAGSVTGATSKRTVRSIVRSAAKSAKLAQLLFRIARHYQSVNVLELGTSLGITTTYLALAQKKIPSAAYTYPQLHTIEGDPAIARTAAANFSKLNLSHIHQSVGNFDAILPTILPPSEPYDFVYVDGNHRYEPTIHYFSQLLPHMHTNSVMIFDDIHWSAGMEKAWEAIKQHPSVLLTIDLFFVGLVFIRPEFLLKQHFTIRF